MNVWDMILAVGSDGVTFQLETDFHSVRKTKKRGTKVVFYTRAIQAEELLDGGRSDKMGIILWLPRSRVEAAVEADRKRRGNEHRT